MSELPRQVEAYLDELKRENASVHTVRSYGTDLRQFVDYLTPEGSQSPTPAELDVLVKLQVLAGKEQHQVLQQQALQGGELYL